MIRQTLPATKAATFSVLLPSLDPSQVGMPAPAGTGFFVSPDGWFVTATHVLCARDGTLRDDLSELLLDKEMDDTLVPAMVHGATVDLVSFDADIALLKFDFKANSNKAFLKQETGFPHLSISARVLADGEPVYAFGYPLGSSEVRHPAPQQGMIVGHISHRPRVTSAIVASKIEATQMATVHGQPPAVYALDKALNYGNSGGPIVASETGRVHGVCVRFQPVAIPQHHLTEPGKQLVRVLIPSLYGLASNLTRSDVAPELVNRGIAVDES